MNRKLMALGLVTLSISSVTMAADLTTTASVDTPSLRHSHPMRPIGSGNMMRRWSGARMDSGMMTEWKNMRATTSGNRAQMMANASGLRQDFQPLNFLRTDLSSGDKATLKAARDTAQSTIKALKDDYAAQIKANPTNEAALTAELNTKIAAARQTELDIMSQYVASGSEAQFQAFESGANNVIDENGVLRADNVQARVNFRTDLYSTKTVNAVNNIQAKLDAPLAAMSDDKKIAILTAIVNKIDAMIPQLQSAGTDTELLVAFKAKLEDMLGIPATDDTTTSVSN